MERNLIVFVIMNALNNIYFTRLVKNEILGSNSDSNALT
jgi:hypothetical protein